MTDSIDYKQKMFDELSAQIEAIGKDDENYNDHQKALDILGVLEGLLGYTIYTTCTSLDEVRDSSEESYVNIKRTALTAMRKELDSSASE